MLIKLIGGNHLRHKPEHHVWTHCTDTILYVSFISGKQGKHKYLTLVIL